MDKIKVCFDVGGVLSKYPDIFVPLLKAMEQSDAFEVYVVSDMHPQDKIQSMLKLNGVELPNWRVASADYKALGENCKAVLCKQIKAHILIDDFIGYLAVPDAPPVRLLVMPDPNLPYYHDSWQTDGSEGDFGRRRNPSGSKRPPEDR